MSYDKEKLSRFQKTVLSEAEEKIRKIKEEAEEYKKTELEKTRQSEYDRIFTYMQAQVHNLEWKYRQIVTKKNLEAKREILVYRNELTEKVFAQTTEKLRNFAASAEYREYLTERLKKAAEHFPCEGTVIAVREEDTAFEKDLLKAVAGADSVVVDKSNNLGGFRLINRAKGLLLDETLANDLIEQRQYFYKISGMTVAN